MDLNLVNIEDIPCIGETIQRLTSLGREEIPDAAGIDEFNYNPEADHSEAALEGGVAKEVSNEDAESTPSTQDPPVDPQGKLDRLLFFFPTKFCKYFGPFKPFPVYSQLNERSIFGIMFPLFFHCFPSKIMNITFSLQKN